jgi:hypothetical protein
MCFGPSAAEKRAAAEQRAEAEIAKRQAIEERATQKREDISTALTATTASAGKRGGTGRRSLFTSMMGGAGYASRFK